MFIIQYFCLVGASQSEVASSVILFEQDHNYRRLQ